jgi:hypothetical protein
MNFDVGDNELKEGQAINWVSRDTIRQLPMAYYDGVVVETFFRQLGAGESSRLNT